jgi:hypothetical protein
MVKVSDLRTTSWTQIDALLEAGGRPKISDLSAALRRGEPVPKRAQDHIAALLAGKVRRPRGRQELPDGEHPKMYPFKKKHMRDFKEQMLIITVAQLVKEKRNQSDPIRSAIAQIADARNLDASTIRRYYTKACARWPEYVADTYEK